MQLSCKADEEFYWFCQLNEKLILCEFEQNLLTEFHPVGFTCRRMAWRHLADTD